MDDEYSFSMGRKKRSGGKVGPVVVYKLLGKTVMRALPHEYEQTAATKARGLNFGLAARMGASLRAGLHKKLVPFPKEFGMQSRLAGAISKWMGATAVADLQPEKEISTLIDFHFNLKAVLNSTWRGMLNITETAEGELELNIPAFIPAAAIHAPANTRSVECVFGVACCNLLSQTSKPGSFASVHIPWDRTEIPGQSIPLNVNIEKGDLVLVAASLIYTIEEKVLVENREAEFLPADVIKAMYV